MAFAAAALLLLLGGTVRAGGGPGEAQMRLAEGEATSRRGSAAQEPFRWTVQACGDRLRSEWRDRREAIVAWDEVHSGTQGMETYRLVRPALGQDWRAERDGRWITVASPGRFEQVHVEAGRIVLAGAQLVDYIASRLPALRAGERLEVAYLLPEHARVIDLRIRARADAGRAEIEVRVEPAMALLRALVPPTVIRFAPDGDFLSLEGTLLPQAGTPDAPRPLLGIARRATPPAAARFALSARSTDACITALASRRPG